jgi:hypothetical protein
MQVSIMCHPGGRFPDLDAVPRPVRTAIEEAIARGATSGKVECDGLAYTWTSYRGTVRDDEDEDD